MKKKKIIILSIISVVVLACIITGICIFINNGKKDTLTSKKIVENLEFTNSKITYQNGISTLTADVKNKGDDREDVMIKITFYDKNGKKIIAMDSSLGDIKKDETTTLNTSITKKLENIGNVTYEIRN